MPIPLARACMAFRDALKHDLPGNLAAEYAQLRAESARLQAEMQQLQADSTTRSQSRHAAIDMLEDNWVTNKISAIKLECWLKEHVLKES